MKLRHSIFIVLITLSCNQKQPENNIPYISDNKNVNSNEINYELIKFPSVGAVLVGKLYTPKNIRKKHPVIIMAHGFSATIDGMTSDKYAEAFHNAGFAVLLYDHRNFGRSGGEPRQEINYWVQARGYIDAINYVHTLNYINVNKIALWGCSLSSAEAFTVGAIDNRVSAIIGQIPAFGDEPVPFEEAKSTMRNIKDLLLNEHLDTLKKNETNLMPIVSSNQDFMASALTELTAFRWFMEYGGRFNTNWQNRVSFSRFKSAPKNFHYGITAAFTKAPTLLVVAKNDEMEGASDVIAKTVFDKIPQPKEIVQVDGGHFGLLHYPSTTFNISSKAQVEFLINQFNLEKK